ncbi:hypothetical protein NDU88_003882 [Pleurodeles waltl]|uniref:Uncharacterized protein n=1 Tax=Pleurodeles waltl TaxID=8319 RepID=A0AAV7RGF6_PLEWA|nr:hypothetical protein NDU88_003882 [Pleurodeles waltl]
MDRTRSGSAPQGDRGTTQDTGDGTLDTDDQAGPSHSPGMSPSSSPTQDITDTPTTQPMTSAQGNHPHTCVSRQQTGGTQVQRPQSPPTKRQEDDGPSTSGTARPVQGTQAQGARTSGRASVAQGGGHKMDAAAQDMISEVLGAYYHTQDRLDQVVSTPEKSRRMQQAHHQEAMELWKLHTATMASIAGTLLQLFQTHPEAQDTDRTTRASASTSHVLPSEEIQGTSITSPTGQQQAPKRTLRPRYGTGTPAKNKAPSKK